MFALNPMLEPGDTVTLEMEYDANVNYNVLGGYGEMVTLVTVMMIMMMCAGIWKQPCDGSASASAKQCWFTQFEWSGARQLFPCLDEPRAKATFDVRVARTGETSCSVECSVAAVCRGLGHAVQHAAALHRAHP